MRRPILGFVFLCICASPNALRAQEFKVFDRAIQVHGFASQGFVYTDQNNWLTMNTRQGSFAMTDLGLNVSSQITDKFRVGAQVYDRNLGELGQWHPSLDWAVADYRFKNWLGIRAGKVKTTLGLYNDSQDVDFLRVFALLPQSIYPTDLRDTTIAHAGGDLYGNVALPHRLGDLSYTAYAGYRSDSIYSGYPYLLTQWGVFFRSMRGLQYGGDLRWNTPMKGLMIGASRMNQEITGKGSAVNLLNPSAGLLPYDTSTNAYWTNQFYGEYHAGKLNLNAEYRRYYNSVPYAPGAGSAETDVRGWYVSGAYRLGKRVEIGSYYSYYSVRSSATGVVALILTPQTDTSLPQNHVYDKVVAARVDLNRFLYVKVEGHFMDGYGIGPYPDGFYPQQNPTGFKPTTNALVAKTGFHF
jgi:hypothetical protein